MLAYALLEYQLHAHGEFVLSLWLRELHLFLAHAGAPYLSVAQMKEEILGGKSS